MDNSDSSDNTSDIYIGSDDSQGENNTEKIKKDVGSSKERKSASKSKRVSKKTSKDLLRDVFGLDSEESDEDKFLEENKKIMQEKKERKQAAVQIYNNKNTNNDPTGLQLRIQLKKEGFDISDHAKEIGKEKYEYNYKSGFTLEEFCKIHTKNKKGAKVLKAIILEMKANNVPNAEMDGLADYNARFYACDIEDITPVTVKKTRGNKK